MIKEPIIDLTKSWGLFDGACQGTLGLCGTKETLFINNHHSFTLKYGVGIDTNNRVEFFALWILIKYVAEKGVHHFVLSYSKLLIDWQNDKCQITNLALEAIIHSFRDKNLV